VATQLRQFHAERELERLYRLHRREVFRAVLRDVGNPDEAEDVTQTAFLDAYRALQRGDEPVRPRAWLLTIAQNAARRRYRARAAGPREVELQAELLVAPDEAGPSAVELREAIARLGPRQRKALVLREIAGRSYAEIAAALELSVPAVETLLFRARRALRQELTGWEPARPRRRRLTALLPWPLTSPGDAAGSLAGWAGSQGAAVKVAGALSAAALGTGVALQGGDRTPADPLPQERAAVHEPARTLASPPRATPNATERAPARRDPARTAESAPASGREPAPDASAGPLEVVVGPAEVPDPAGPKGGAPKPPALPSVPGIRRTALPPAPEAAGAYIRKTPKVVSGIGAFNAAEIPSATTRRVSTGSITPSSQRRAVE
jgi:RNA polymerase sigma factor (sigma-70 family)